MSFRLLLYSSPLDPPGSFESNIINSMSIINRVRKIFRAQGYLFLIISLFAIGAFLRLYNFQNRLIFGPEQGMSFIVTASNLEKFSLLGETNLIRATSAGHIPFHGAMYNYLLLPFLLIFNFKVLPVTILFAVLNLVTAFILFKVANKIFGKTIAALSLFFFLFSDVMIHHSLFAWVVNPTPLLGVLTLWFIYKQIKNRNSFYPVLWVGIMSGFGFGLQSFYILFAGILFLLTIIISKKKLFTAFIFLFGVMLGSLPTVIFDIRHDFYHLRTFAQYFYEVAIGTASGTSTYYNYLFLYPYLFLLYAFISKIFYKIKKPLILIPLIIFLYGSLNSPFINLHQSVGMAPGITLKSLESAAFIINKDNPPQRFNVATLWDFDTRANPLRYILSFNYHKKPQAVEEYKNIDALYVFAPEDYDMKIPRVWELQIFMPYKITDLSLPVPGYRLYKLTK